jgi:hypothetical protein
MSDPDADWHGHKQAAEFLFVDIITIYRFALAFDTVVF